MKMRAIASLLAGCLLEFSTASPVQSALQELQPASHQRHALSGRFLHITDLHPDPYYKIGSSTEESKACHGGKGMAGVYGAETSDCDTPYSLINATFKWIKENIKDDIDFVVWTGDSARHDSDEHIPRTQKEVLNTNRWVAEKFAETFSKPNDPTNSLSIPIISTFGNNDILPHNILLSGPNKWLKSYKDIWHKFIPEEQRHGFERGGWYYVEVIPHKLAVFSLNTLYFFNNNAAVDGCSLRSEPGFEHFEWLRIQLQFMRERGMKAILTGHVPPARTDSKKLWDETCWQKYTLWLQQYRDVVVGGLYGHMNIDHFMLQDTKEIDILDAEETAASRFIRASLDDELTIQSANDYLEELRENWSTLPNPAAVIKEEPDHVEGDKKKKGKKSKKDKLLKKIGGPWGERFQVTNVGPSLVPNYFPTLRVIEYNITGLENAVIWADAQSVSASQKMDWLEEVVHASNPKEEHEEGISIDEDDEESILKKKKKKGKKKKPSNPDLTVPSPPSKSSPPGPAYSPQSLTMLGYTQYFANLTYINNAHFVDSEDVEADKWREGKHKGKKPSDKDPKPRPFQYQVEYDTFSDPVFKLKDMTVRSYLKLAHRIGKYLPEKGDSIDDLDEADNDEYDDPAANDEDNNDDDGTDADKKKKKKEKHKKKKHHKQKEKNKVWLQFIQRAFVGTLSDEELRTFDYQDQAPVMDLSEAHDGEL
ncbi:hypothetical protein G7Y89_g659 [Cudoniella acicularis]|uniref:Endopolyphosphatase n=1 Tax=Cudoniella acicularis TaxID=354080 RepID=A0A8H4W7R6_9HELO|nr:hypothetical protein G7Y89_g659 [Cudoniella acicularis]